MPAGASQPEDKKPDFLGSHFIPVVLGPARRPYLIDHHHLTRALHDEGVQHVAVTVLADLSSLDAAAFWFYLDNRAWSFLYDGAGERQSHRKLPKHVKGLVDDPYRSLAGELRRAGGFAKDVTPFSEFLWADFLRRRIKRKQAHVQPEAALDEALRLAKSPEAAFLPGWCGPGRTRMKQDALAGISVAGLLLPSAIAYAAIAGLSPNHAIIATIVGLGVYALVGRSRFAMVSANFLIRGNPRRPDHLDAA